MSLKGGKRTAYSYLHYLYTNFLALIRGTKISMENLRGAKISVEDLRGMKNVHHLSKNTPTLLTLVTIVTYGSCFEVLNKKNEIHDSTCQFKFIHIFMTLKNKIKNFRRYLSLHISQK